MKKINELLRPGGLFISKTSCLGEQSSLWPILAFVISKLWFLPYIKSFAVSELKEFMTHDGLEIIETVTLSSAALPRGGR